MKMINTFKICIEKYASASKQDQITWTKQLITTDDKDRKKELRYCLASVHTFYKVTATHKNTKKSNFRLFDSRAEITKGLIDFLKDIIYDIRNDRSLNNAIISDKTYLKGYRCYKVGLVHKNPGDFSRALLKKITDRFYTTKKPLSKKRHIGVELELYIPKDYDEQLAFDLYQLDKTLLKKVCIKDDGSLRPKDNESDIEIAIVDTEDKIQETLSKVLGILNENGARVDKRCGVHVHVDMRDRVAEIAFHNFVQAQNVMFKMLTKERKKNEFCVPVRGTSIYKYYGGNRRYWSINATSIAKFNTIEIRMHHGSLDSKRLNNWVNLLINIANKKNKVKTAFRSIKSLGKTFNLPKPIIEYSHEIINKEMSA